MTTRTTLPMPPGWLALGLLGWGLLTDAVAGAFTMAALLEGIRLAPVKWSVARRDFHRAADLGSVVFALLAVIQFQRYSVHGIYEILRVTPYALFPLMLVQRASTLQAVPLSALVYGLRRDPDGERSIDIAPWFLATCVLAACTTAREGTAYGTFCAVTLGGVLLAARPRRYATRHWLSTLVLAAALGLGATQGIRVGQGAIEAAMLYWFNQFPWATGGDANRAFTAIGAIGRLKLSDQIRVRVTPTPGLSVPLLLQQASYDGFKYGTWSAGEAPFSAIDKDTVHDRWSLQGGAPESERIEITFQHARELALLPLPRGTAAVTSDEIAELQRNRFDSIMAEAPAGALRFVVSGHFGHGLEPPPTARDREVPPEYAAVIARANAAAGVSGRDAGTDALGIRDYFLRNFTYTLVQRGSHGQRLPLTRFLDDTHRGHCEYFASAAVLMLRAAGIPARYAVGYVVENYSPLERAYIARARHAHAWALAYVDARWQVIDATPATWFDLEENRASGWQTIGDLLGWSWYRFQRLRQADIDTLGDTLLWLVPPLAIVLYLRLRHSPNAVAQAPRRDAQAVQAAQPAPLVPLLAACAARGFAPARGETLSTFLRRVAPAEGGGEAREVLLADYYRWRYAAGDRCDTAILVARFGRYAQAL